MDKLICKFHKKQNEAFCSQCLIPICSECVFSNLHVTHTFLNLKQSAENIRNDINDLIQDNLLSKDFTDKRLVELKGVKAEMILYSKTLSEEIEKIIDDLIKKLINKKQQLSDFILENLHKQLEIIKEQETKWKEKEKKCKELLNYASNVNDNIVLNNSKNIYESFSLLNEELEIRHVYVYDSLNLNLKFCRESLKINKKCENCIDLNKEDLINKKKYLNNKKNITLPDEIYSLNNKKNKHREPLYNNIEEFKNYLFIEIEDFHNMIDSMCIFSSPLEIEFSS